MKSKIRDEKLDFLFRAILTLETLEDCYNFFEDLCTVSGRRCPDGCRQQNISENYIYSEIAQQTEPAPHHKPGQPLSQIRQRRLYKRALKA